MAGIFINTRAAFILARLRGRTKLGHVTVTERGWICTCGVANTAVGLVTDSDNHTEILQRHILAAFVRRHRNCAT